MRPKCSKMEEWIVMANAQCGEIFCALGRCSFCASAIRFPRLLVWPEPRHTFQKDIYGANGFSSVTEISVFG